MQFEPMIKARINSFKTHHALSNIPEESCLSFLSTMSFCVVINLMLESLRK